MAKEKKEKLKKKQIGYDCSCCDFARELPNKDLENDFVYCCNPDCEFYYHVLFEHFKCKKDDDKANIKDILNKNFPSAVCQHCNKVTNIQFSNDFGKLVSRNRTLSEINKTLKKDWHRWMNIKNGQIEAMHKIIAKLVGLIPEKMKEKSKEITQEMRDEIKHAEKKLNEGKNE